MQPVSQQNEASFQFDAFELDPVRRVLLREGKAIGLKPKVFETLLVLVRNSGRVMDKDELMQRSAEDSGRVEAAIEAQVSLAWCDRSPSSGAWRKGSGFRVPRQGLRRAG